MQAPAARQARARGARGRRERRAARGGRRRTRPPGERAAPRRHSGRRAAAARRRAPEAASSRSPGRRRRQRPEHEREPGEREQQMTIPARHRHIMAARARGRRSRADGLPSRGTIPRALDGARSLAPTSLLLVLSRLDSLPRGALRARDGDGRAVPVAGDRPARLAAERTLRRRAWPRAARRRTACPSACGFAGPKRWPSPARPWSSAHAARRAPRRLVAGRPAAARAAGPALTNHRPRPAAVAPMSPQLDELRSQRSASFPAHDRAFAVAATATLALAAPAIGHETVTDRGTAVTMHALPDDEPLAGSRRRSSS